MTRAVVSFGCDVRLKAYVVHAPSTQVDADAAIFDAVWSARIRGVVGRLLNRTLFIHLLIYVDAILCLH